MNWRHAGYIVMLLSLAMFVVAFFLWREGHPYSEEVLVAGAITFPIGWIAVLIDRVGFISCAVCGWRGSKRRWRRAGGCPRCGSHMDWS